MDSFNPANIGIRVVLLFSALEALFNTTRRKIGKTVAEYSSKILFTTDCEKEINVRILKGYYDIRSKFIHGNELDEIMEKDEMYLREIVRKVLLIYYYISFHERIFEPEEMMRFLDENNEGEISEMIKLFLMCLKNGG